MPADAAASPTPEAVDAALAVLAAAGWGATEREEYGFLVDDDASHPAVLVTPGRQRHTKRTLVEPWQPR